MKQGREQKVRWQQPQEHTGGGSHLGVDDHNVVATVHGRVVDGLVLACRADISRGAPKGVRAKRKAKAKASKRPWHEAFASAATAASPLQSSPTRAPPKGRLHRRPRAWRDSAGGAPSHGPARASSARRTPHELCALLWLGAAHLGGQWKCALLAVQAPGPWRPPAPSAVRASGSSAGQPGRAGVSRG